MASPPGRRRSVATAPNTPPCILTILSAASWLPRSVAPQQSSSSRHSKPRSLASRMVVWTQTSVVMPVSTRLSMPRWRRISSRSVAQNEPLPGLSITGSPGSGASSGMISQPGSPRTRMRPHGPGIADAGADPPRAPALVGRQVGEVGAVALARVDDRDSRRARIAPSTRADRLDRRAGQREVVAHAVDIAALAAEIGLHVDDDQRRVVGAQVAVPGPGVGVGGDVMLGHRGRSRVIC